MTRAKFNFVKDVPIQNLLLDMHNPRIRSGADQADCIARILRKPKLLIALASDIASEGLSTAPILVEPTERRRYRVWDGNRRVTALKLLNDPTLCHITALRHQIEGIRSRAVINIPSSVDVYASTDTDALLAEVLKRHAGQRDGAGQVNWSAFLRTIFLIGHGHSAADKRAGQLFLWAEEHGVEVDDDFPITSITRFLSKANLKALGFDVTDDNVSPLIDLDKAIAVTQHLAADFAPGGGKSVDDVFENSQQAAYIAHVRAAVGLATNHGGNASTNSSDGDEENEGRGRKAKGSSGKTNGGKDSKERGANGKGKEEGKGPAKPSWERKYLFSKTGAPGFNPSVTKAANIVAELRRLEPAKTPIAVAALFRMLLEFSTNHYMRTHRGVKRENKTHLQIAAVAEHMAEKGMLNAAELKVVLRRTRENEGLMNYETLGAYMHSDKAHPHAQGLNTLWDEVDAYVKACWAG